MPYRLGTDTPASTYQVRAEFLASSSHTPCSVGNGFAVVTRYDGWRQAGASSSAVTSGSWTANDLEAPLSGRTWPVTAATGPRLQRGVGYCGPYDPDVMHADRAAPTVVHMRRPGSSTGVVGESPLTETAPSWRRLAAEAHAAFVS